MPGNSSEPAAAEWRKWRREVWDVFMSVKVKELIARHEHAHLCSPLVVSVSGIAGEEGIGSLRFGGGRFALEKDAPGFGDASVVVGQ